jgi:hypothetical protein
VQNLPQKENSTTTEKEMNAVIAIGSLIREIMIITTWMMVLDLWMERKQTLDK